MKLCVLMVHRNEGVELTGGEGHLMHTWCGAITASLQASGHNHSWAEIFQGEETGTDWFAGEVTAMD